MSRTQPGAERADSGFSLLEALVAVFLLALAAMVIVGTLPGRPAAGIAAAERLRHDLEDIRDRAIISGQAQAIPSAITRSTLGVSATGSGRSQAVRTRAPFSSR